GKDAESRLVEILKNEKLTFDRPLVVIHPGSSNPAEVWLKENYAELIRELSGSIDCNIAVIGSKEESGLAGEIISGSGKQVYNFAGRLDLKTLTAFLKKANLFIGNDTGPMHMASVLGVPVIAIFGRNIPGVSSRRWGPLNKRSRVFYKDPGCAVCLDINCPYDYKCLRSVLPGEVLKASKELLEKV
ncbi:MAG: glycosyltransferase family 9 protein, partial [Candidatus Omnitrophica bacterium]|nr:glycosyltransferase family 9 protein [Candidatus Omnitrophota bacterium]